MFVFNVSQSLASVCEDNQAQEIVKKLEKSLELLNQYATRVASKAEMLGAIHQVGDTFQKMQTLASLYRSLTGIAENCALGLCHDAVLSTLQSGEGSMMKC